MAATESRTGLGVHGIETGGTVYWNPTTSQLYTHALERGDGRLAEGGPLAVDTGKHTGRSPKDKFVVREPGSEDRIWWGEVNAEISEEHFEGLREKVVAHIGDTDLYVVDAFAGADPAQRIAIRVVTNHPYHALFARTMFIDPTEEEATRHYLGRVSWALSQGALHPEDLPDPVTFRRAAEYYAVPLDRASAAPRPGFPEPDA